MSCTISRNKKKTISELYYQKGYSMNELATHLGVSLNAVVFFFRKHALVRRTLSDAQRLRFDRKPPTFTKNKINSFQLKELAAIGVMLYWGEGYKGSTIHKNYTVDFANSDVLMIRLFLKFLRTIYRLDEKKLRVLLYCYSNQDSQKLIRYWSKVTVIPTRQFSRPYIRKDFKPDGRKMKYGLIHIRYSDKKLLLDILSMIHYYVQKHAPVA